MKNTITQIVENPENIENLGTNDILELLYEIRSFLSGNNEFPLINLHNDEHKNELLYFSSDTHGDLKVTKWMIDHVLKPSFKEKKYHTKLIFLGDYVDRSPQDIKLGGLKNVLYLLCNKIQFPGSLYLLRGNHEGYNLLNFGLYELPKEIEELWNKSNLNEVHETLLGIFSRLPLFVKTSNGIFASHGGFPKNMELEHITPQDTDSILETLWGDPANYAPYRGTISTMTNFTKMELFNFLKKINCNIMLRGHNYQYMGFSIFDDRLLTIFSSRRYSMKGAGGVLLAKSSLSESVQSTKDIDLLDLENNRLKKKQIRQL